MDRNAESTVFLHVLGIAQDAGAPQLGCRKACCETLRERNERIPAASIALVDRTSDRIFLVDATPDLRDQLDSKALRAFVHPSRRPVDGILLTHAHIGHYAGLIFLGRESMATDHVPIHATERFCAFLERNGPWDLAVRAGHVSPTPFAPEKLLQLTDHLKVTPFLVPHRDEYTDTVGFVIEGPTKRAIYLPDVDVIDEALWQRLVACDVLLLDGTFYRDGELGERDMSQIPHPRVTDVLERWKALDPAPRPALYFIHLNHTNPALDPTSAEARHVQAAGAHVARVGQRIAL